jgi:hypothetical protein
MVSYRVSDPSGAVSNMMHSWPGVSITPYLLSSSLSISPARTAADAG